MVKLVAENRISSNMQRGLSIEVHCVSYKQSLSILFSLQGTEDHQCSEVNRKRFVASLNKDFADYPDRAKFQTAAMVTEIIAVSETWFAAAMANLNPKYKCPGGTKAIVTA